MYVLMEITILFIVMGAEKRGSLTRFVCQTAICDVSTKLKFLRAVKMETVEKCYAWFNCALYSSGAVTIGTYCVNVS